MIDVMIPVSVVTISLAFILWLILKPGVGSLLICAAGNILLAFLLIINTKKIEVEKEIKNVKYMVEGYVTVFLLFLMVDLNTEDNDGFDGGVLIGGLLLGGALVADDGGHGLGDGGHGGDDGGDGGGDGGDD